MNSRHSNRNRYPCLSFHFCLQSSGYATSFKGSVRKEEKIGNTKGTIELRISNIILKRGQFKKTISLYPIGNHCKTKVLIYRVLLRSLYSPNFRYYFQMQRPILHLFIFQSSPNRLGAKIFSSTYYINTRIDILHLVPTSICKEHAWI